MFRFNSMILSNSNNRKEKKKEKNLMKRNDFHILRRKTKNDS